MNELLKYFNNIYWWLSVVAVGILINLLSTCINVFFQRVLAPILSKFSKYWRNRIRKLKAQKTVRIELLKNDKHEQLMASFSELRLNATSLGTILTSFLLAVGTAWEKSTAKNPNKYIIAVFIFCSVLTFILSFKSFWQARKIRKEIKEARKNVN